MTIFREIAEEFIINSIEKIKATSMSYDNGTVNTFWKMTGLGGRNIELSENKRNRLNQLKNNIQILNTNNDYNTKENLIKLIKICQTDLVDMCLEEKTTTGSTEFAVNELSKFIENVYTKICTKWNLANIEKNNEKINIIKYYAAKACAHSVYQDICNKSAMKENFVLNAEQENIILRSLSLAENVSKMINTNNNSKLINEDAFKQLMQDRAEFIQREINKITQNESSSYVIEYMQQAIDSFSPSINKTEETKENHNEEPTTMKP